jgi:hypothetical protein
MPFCCKLRLERLQSYSGIAVAIRNPKSPICDSSAGVLAQLVERLNGMNRGQIISHYLKSPSPLLHKRISLIAAISPCPKYAKKNPSVDKMVDKALQDWKRQPLRELVSSLAYVLPLLLFGNAARNVVGRCDSSLEIQRLPSPC